MKYFILYFLVKKKKKKEFESLVVFDVNLLEIEKSEKNWPKVHQMFLVRENFIETKDIYTYQCALFQWTQNAMTKYKYPHSNRALVNKNSKSILLYNLV